jgi:hypothetical protein
MVTARTHHPRRRHPIPPGIAVAVLDFRLSTFYFLLSVTPARAGQMYAGLRLQGVKDELLIYGDIPARTIPKS